MYGYGNVFLSQEEYDSALNYYDRAINEDPNYDDARYNRAMVWYNKKRYDQALREAKGILEYNPGYYDAALLIGDGYYSQNKNDSAIYWYEQGYDNGLRSASLCHVMAYLYDVQNNTRKAIPFYKEALSYDSSRIEVYTRLAELVPAEQEKYKALANKYK
jgi:tetratricopeptide (TPR) repeat protein